MDTLKMKLAFSRGADPSLFYLVALYENGGSGELESGHLVDEYDLLAVLIVQELPRRPPGRPITRGSCQKACGKRLTKEQLPPRPPQRLTAPTRLPQATIACKLQENQISNVSNNVRVSPSPARQLQASGGSPVRSARGLPPAALVPPRVPTMQRLPGWSQPDASPHSGCVRGVPTMSASASVPASVPGSRRAPIMAASASVPSSAPGSSRPHMQHSSGSISVRGERRSPSVAATANPAPTHHRIRRQDLHRIGKLGVGAFGMVTLEADRRTGQTYALKAVSKGYLASLRMEYSVLNEKKILKMVDSPFIVRLMATYNDREYVYFLLEAALGGELFTTYERLRLYGSETHARFYVSCVTEALTHLHERHVIYRDLKPENLLLDSSGYCKLTDMGLAKVVQGGQATSMVGTPDYMAPEVVLCTGHGKAVDWWTLGVLLFELLVGKAPFEAETTLGIYDLIQEGIDKVRFPHACQNKSQDLVRSLCRLNPDSRLRTPALRDHGFFFGFDWVALRASRMESPHKPSVKTKTDLSNFRSSEGEDPPSRPYHDTGSGWDVDFEEDALTPARSMSLNPPPVGGRVPNAVTGGKDDSMSAATSRKNVAISHHQHQLQGAARLRAAAVTLQGGMAFQRALKAREGNNLNLNQMRIEGC